MIDNAGTVNIRNFKKRKPYMALTALAGPVSNVFMAVIFVFLGLLVQTKAGISEGSFTYYIVVFMITAAQINISLAVFNLLPLPPLRSYFPCAICILPTDIPC